MNGTAWHFNVHQAWKDEGYEIKGRTLDLKSAYRQLAVAPKDRHAVVIGIFDHTDKKHKLFATNALPFGASGAVMAFNWAAKSLKIALQKLMLVLSSQYFDDFPTVEAGCVGPQSILDTEEFLELLGWGVSKGDKSKPFQQEFSMLGVVVDFATIAKGFITVKISEERKKELVSFAEEVIYSRWLPAAVASSYRGRFGFAYLSFEGRPLAIQMRLLGQRAEQRGGTYWVGDELAAAMQDLITFLKQHTPRKVWISGDRMPMILYTDGACEEKITAGAMLYEPDTDTFEFWGVEVPDSFAKPWRDLGVEHAVAQSETFPVHVSLCTWAAQMRGREVIHFIDNEPVRESLVVGNTKAVASLQMLSDIARRTVANSVKFWHARVPSPSNPSDACSRLDFEFYRSWKNARSVKPIIRPLR